MNKKIIKLLIANNEANSNDIAVYQYGIELLKKKICHIFLILLLSFVCKEIWGMVLFLVAYASIREYSGGYHAKSDAGCYFCTMLVSVAAIFIFKGIRYTQGMTSLWIWIGILFCGIWIWILSPQEAANRPLQNEEKVLYRKITHRYEIIFGILSLFGIWWPIIAYSIAAAWSVQFVMLIGGLLRNRAVE